MVVGDAFVKDSGELIEFAVDRSDAHHDAAVLLIQACEERARESGADRLTVNTRGADRQIGEVMQAVGLIPTTVKSLMYISAVDPGALLEDLLSSSEVPDVDKTLTIRLSDPHEWQSDEYIVGRATTDHRESSITSAADNRTFNDILLGNRSPHGWCSKAACVFDRSEKPLRSSVFSNGRRSTVRGSTRWGMCCDDPAHRHRRSRGRCGFLDG